MMFSSTSRSSGDILADRRYEYARSAFEEKDFVAAADLARQVLELAPHFAAAHALLGRASAATGDRENALGALRQALVHEPDDALGVRLDLAKLGALATEDAISEGYVRALFDEYAPKFDAHLTGNLAYRAPELLFTALMRVCASGNRPSVFPEVVDLGCGTGLMARALAGRYETIAGVDLSPRMLDLARRTGLYDALHEMDLVAYLRQCTPGRVDLILAADVFVYMGALEAAFRVAQRVLKDGALFAFTVQATEGDNFVLGDDARYAHSEAYLRSLAAETGFAVLDFQRVSSREDRGAPVPGFLLILSRS